MQAHRFGCKAEVVSHDEYRLARLCGFAPNDIIYNGPMKSWETFHEAMVGGAIVNIETKRELQWLDRLSEGHVYNVGLRLNINISKVSPEDADGEDDNSRFGFSDETDEFADAVNFISSRSKLRLAGFISIVRLIHVLHAFMSDRLNMRHLLSRSMISILIIWMSVVDISEYSQTSLHLKIMPSRFIDR